MTRRVPEFFFYVKVVKSVCVHTMNFYDLVICENGLPAILVGPPLGRPRQEFVSYHTRVLALYWYELFYYRR
jgi:hypothetical protein